MMAMVEDLSVYPLKTIQDAFTEWRRESTKIPTPADLIRLCNRATRENNNMSGNKSCSDFNGDFGSYIRYLYAKNPMLVSESCYKYLDIYKYPPMKVQEKEDVTLESRKEVQIIVAQATAVLTAHKPKQSITEGASA